MLYLASKSPRRYELLKSLSVEFETLSVDIEETWDESETAEEYVSRIALEKAQAAKKQARQDGLILAADTEVIVDARVMGKPVDREAAMDMLLGLSDRCHTVLSAVVLLGESVQSRLSVNRVCFDNLSRHQCESYCDSGEPYDKAGGYGIQGYAANFLRKLEGSYSSVMGLPLVETAELLGLKLE